MTNKLADLRLKRLIYQSCHRGCKETDHILCDFAHNNLYQMNEVELSLYEEFIEENDWDIFDWLMGKTPFPEKYNTEIIKRIFNPRFNKESK